MTVVVDHLLTMNRHSTTVASGRTARGDFLLDGAPRQFSWSHRWGAIC
jgi:hypothetical protein